MLRPPPETRSFGQRVLLRPSAERLGGNLLHLLDARRWPPRAPRGCARGWSGCRPRRSSTAGSCWSCPRRPRTFSQGMPIISAATRCTSLNASVPRLPMPGWICIAAVGPDDEQAVEAGRAGDERAHRDAGAADLRADALAAARHPLVPVEHLDALVERLLDERAGRVGALAAADWADRTAPCLPAR